MEVVLRAALVELSPWGEINGFGRSRLTRLCFRDRKSFGPIQIQSLACCSYFVIFPIRKLCLPFLLLFGHLFELSQASQCFELAQNKCSIQPLLVLCCRLHSGSRCTTPSVLQSFF